MKNKLIDIHNSLMMSLEMLDDDELFEDPKLAKIAIDRAKAKSEVAKSIIEVDRLGLEAARFSIQTGSTIADTFKLTERKSV